jgi:hypothetical protein
MEINLRAVYLLLIFREMEWVKIAPNNVTASVIFFGVFVGGRVGI